MTSFGIISIENRMNASTFRNIWARVIILKFSKSHDPRVRFENFENITSDHISQKARAIIRFLIYDILNKIIKESIFGTYFSVKHLQLFIQMFVLVGLNFLSFAHFSQTFNYVCVDLVVFLFFAFSFSWSTTISSDEANRLSTILLFVFKFRTYPIVSTATFVLHYITSRLHSMIY